MIKSRTLILVLCFLVVATATTIFVLKSKSSKTPNIDVPMPLLDVPKVSSDAITIKPSVNGRYGGFPTYEQYRNREILHTVNDAEIPDDWVELKREDLGISFKVPSDYKNIGTNSDIYENYLYLSFYNLTISTGYGYFPVNIYDKEQDFDFSILPAGLKVYLEKDLHNGKDLPEGKENMVMAMELPYLVKQRYLFFEFPLSDLTMLSQVVKSINKLPVDVSRYKEKVYINTELGFKTKFPVPKDVAYNLSENFQSGSKGSFSAGIEEGLGIRGIGKDFTCECDAYFIRSFPESSEWLPVQRMTNKHGVEYGIMTSTLKPEDDELGELPHVGDKIYIIKTKNKDFPVLTIWTGNVFDESIAEFVIDSFELI